MAWPVVAAEPQQAAGSGRLMMVRLGARRVVSCCVVPAERGCVQNEPAQGVAMCQRRRPGRWASVQCGQ